MGGDYSKIYPGDGAGHADMGSGPCWSVVPRTDGVDVGFFFMME